MTAERDRRLSLTTFTDPARPSVSLSPSATVHVDPIPTPLTKITLYPNPQNTNSPTNGPTKNITFTRALEELRDLVIREEEEKEGEEDYVQMSSASITGDLEEDYVEMNDQRGNYENVPEGANYHFTPSRTKGDYSVNVPDNVLYTTKNIFSDVHTTNTISSAPDTWVYTGVNYFNKTNLQDTAATSNGHRHSRHLEGSPYADRFQQFNNYSTPGRSPTPPAAHHCYRRRVSFNDLPHHSRPTYSIPPVRPPMPPPMPIVHNHSDIYRSLPNNIGHRLNTESCQIGVEPTIANRCETDIIYNTVASGQTKLDDLSVKMEQLMGSIERQNRRIDSIHQMVDVRQSKRKKRVPNDQPDTYKSLDVLATHSDVYYKREPSSESKNCERAVVRPNQEKKKLKKKLLLSCIP